MNYELDFALEQKVRDISQMSRAELEDFATLLVKYHRSLQPVLTDFQGIINQQSSIIYELSSRLLKDEPNN